MTQFFVFVPSLFLWDLFVAISDFLPNRKHFTEKYFCHGNGAKRVCQRYRVTWSQQTDKYSCSLDFVSTVPVLSGSCQTQRYQKTMQLLHCSKDKSCTCYNKHNLLEKRNADRCHTLLCWSEKCWSFTPV